MRIPMAGAITVAIAVGAACGGVTMERASRDDAGAGGTGGGGSVPPALGEGGGAIRRQPGTGFCGDGILNGDELCDRYDFGNETCRSATMSRDIGGSLRCTSRCTLDVSGCNYTGAGGRLGVGGIMGVAGTLGLGGRNSGGTGGSLPNTGGSPAGTGDADAGSIGDPHVMTLDGLKYDFQAVGEFILIEDKDDPVFVVQIRQAPFLGLSTMSVNTAVAARVAGDRVAFYAGESPPVRVNGVARSVDGSIELPHGGGLTNDQETYTVTWPTGEELVVATTWKSLVNVNYRRSPGRTRRVHGLLGTHDGIAENDLTTRSGTTLRTPSRPEELYRVFGRSFRIADAESLFDYSPGEATATYTDLSFPLLHGIPPHPPTAEIARAQRLCEQAGVVGPHALESCAVDVAITGDIGFAKAARLRRP